jgi:anthranilate synthase component 1
MDFNFMAPPRGDWSVQTVPRPDDREEFLRGVASVRDEIVRGNLLQGVLSRRVQVRTDMPSRHAVAALGQPRPTCST